MKAKKSLTLLSCGLLTTMAAIGFPAIAEASMPPIVNGQPVTSLSGVIQKVMPCVVNIAAQGDLPSVMTAGAQPDDPDAIKPGGKFAAYGSGVVVDAKNGYILTNAHVVRDAQTVTVTLNDARVFRAKLIGVDTPSDIAVLQIKADKLTAASLGDSDILKVGDFVAAIGNPFDLSQTVTSGIISALQRNNLGIEGYENFIQTDASINPGNSGGALVSLNGQVIGINTAIVSPGGGNIGIGFAIPMNMARSVMNQLIKYGSVQRGMMGIIVQDFSPALASAFNLTGKTGALVAQVMPNTPASTAGVASGDLIETINGTPVSTAAQVRNIVGLVRVGSSVDLKILHDGDIRDVTLSTADPKKYMEMTQENNPFLFGVAFRDFDEQTVNQGHLMGVQVVNVAQVSFAWRAGIRPGDVILTANQKTIGNIQDLQKIAHTNASSLLLNIYSHEGIGEYVVIKQPQNG